MALEAILPKDFRRQVLSAKQFQRTCRSSQSIRKISERRNVKDRAGSPLSQSNLRNARSVQSAYGRRLSRSERSPDSHSSKPGSAAGRTSCSRAIQT